MYVAWWGFPFVLTFHWFFLYHAPQSHSSPLVLLTTLHPYNLPSTAKKKKTLVAEAVVCHSVSRSTPLCPHIFACKCSLHWLIGLVQGHWLLLLWQYCNFTGTLDRYLAVALSYGISCSFGSVGPTPSCTPAWGRCCVGVGQFKDLDLGMRVFWAAHPAGLPLSCPRGWLIYIQGQVYCAP